MRINIQVGCDFREGCSSDSEGTSYPEDAIVHYEDSTQKFRISSKSLAARKRTAVSREPLRKRQAPPQTQTPSPSISRRSPATAGSSSHTTTTPVTRAPAIATSASRALTTTTTTPQTNAKQGTSVSPVQSPTTASSKPPLATTAATRSVSQTTTGTAGKNQGNDNGTPTTIITSGTATSYSLETSTTSTIGGATQGLAPNDSNSTNFPDGKTTGISVGISLLFIAILAFAIWVHSRTHRNKLRGSLAESKDSRSYPLYNPHASYIMPSRILASQTHHDIENNAFKYLKK